MCYQPKNVQWPPITRFLKSLGVDIKVHTKPLPATRVVRPVKTLFFLAIFTLELLIFEKYSY